MKFQSNLILIGKHQSRWISVASHLFQLVHIQLSSWKFHFFLSWQFFSSFSGSKLLGLFCSPKQCFLGSSQSRCKQTQSMMKTCILLGQTFPMGYRAHKIEIICKSYDPENLMYPIEVDMTFGTSSPRVRFLQLYGFHITS